MLSVRDNKLTSTLPSPSWVASQFVAGFLLLCLLPNRSPAQKTATWDPVFRTVCYEFRLMNPTSETVTNIDIYLPLPHQSPRQEIHYLLLSSQGQQRVFTDIHGQRLAHYSFAELTPGAWVDVGFVTGATLRNLRWVSPEQTVGPGGPALTAEERERYLQPRSHYSMDTPLMRATVAELIRSTTNDFMKVSPGSSKAM